MKRAIPTYEEFLNESNLNEGKSEQSKKILAEIKDKTDSNDSITTFEVMSILLDSAPELKKYYKEKTRSETTPAFSCPKKIFNKLTGLTGDDVSRIAYNVELKTGQIHVVGSNLGKDWDIKLYHLK